MKTHRFYLNQSITTGASITLSKQEAHHIIQVLKLSAGQHIVLFNGDGNNYDAQITEASRRSATINILSKKAGISCGPLNTHMYISISKGDRTDFAIQKAVELGVSAITPIISNRTVVKLDAERLKKRQQHWQQVIISACEQSGRSDLPTLHDTRKLKTVVFPENTSRFILVPDTEQKLAHQQLMDNICFIIGPEGGLNPEEIQYCIETHEFQTVSLGDTILRTETAPIVVLSILQCMKGSFR